MAAKAEVLRFGADRQVSGPLLTDNVGELSGRNGRRPEVGYPAGFGAQPPLE